MPQEVEELLDKAAEGDEAASQALRFPLSCGEPRNEVDKECAPPAPSGPRSLHTQPAHAFMRLRRLQLMRAPPILPLSHPSAADVKNLRGSPSPRFPRGSPCSVVDIIFNLDVLKQAIAYKRLKARAASAQAARLLCPRRAPPLRNSLPVPCLLRPSLLSPARCL